MWLAGATTASAWECPPGVEDSLENQKAGICVEITPTPTPTPKKRHHKPVPPTPGTPTTTPLPTVTSAATPTAATPAPTASPTSPAPPASLPTSPTSSPPPNSQSPGEVCVFEPTTQQWEIRKNHFGDTLEAGQRWPMEKGLCEQDQPSQPTKTTISTLKASDSSTSPVSTPTPVMPQPSPPTPQPTMESPPQATSSICLYSPDLLPLLDEYGEQARDEATDYPLWLINGDDSGTIMLGPECPIQPQPLPEPVVPVQLPG
jgi:hypothetical protein